MRSKQLDKSNETNHLTDEETTRRARSKNVVDMAITFTAMTRLFEKGSKRKIADALAKSFNCLASVKDKADFEGIHSEFCTWFTRNIFTAQKTFKSKDGLKTKQRRPASYGQAAKVFDIAVKVYVYYSHLPDCSIAQRLVPMLHGAIDTPIMKHLKKTYKNAEVNSRTIEGVGRPEYLVLQALVVKDIKTIKAESTVENFWPVQYDDIMWDRLNRTTTVTVRGRPQAVNS